MQAQDSKEAKPKMNTFMLMTSKSMIGGVSGWMVGRFCKQISDIAIFYCGLTTLLIGGLNWLNWISINWAEIDEDCLHLVQRGKKAAHDKGLVQKMKRFVMRTAPLLVGFGAGFKMAFFGDE